MTDTTPEQLDRVLDDAVAAAAVLRDRAPAERAAWLRAAADALDNAAERLLPLAQQESHLPLPRPADMRLRRLLRQAATTHHRPMAPPSTKPLSARPTRGPGT